jgi:secreted trypsin-like serine protease
MARIFSIILLLTSPVLSLPTQQSSTESSEWTPFIVGGSEVTPHSLPYQAFIDIEFVASKTWCGASIISTNYLLTASHCIHNPPQVLSKIVAQLGVHTLNSADAGSVTQHIPATNVLYHATMDAALIRLAESITYTDRIQSVGLPQSAEWGLDFVGYAGTISGWGRSENGYLLTLRSVTMNVMSMAGCREYFRNLESHFVCLEGSNGQSACYVRVRLVFFHQNLYVFFSWTSYRVTLAVHWLWSLQLGN